jgi:hypothetical protein
LWLFWAWVGWSIPFTSISIVFGMLAVGNTWHLKSAWQLWFCREGHATAPPWGFDGHCRWPNGTEEWAYQRSSECDSTEMWEEFSEDHGTCPRDNEMWLSYYPSTILHFSRYGFVWKFTETHLILSSTSTCSYMFIHVHTCSYTFDNIYIWHMFFLFSPFEMVISWAKSIGPSAPLDGPSWLRSWPAVASSMFGPGFG